MLQGAHVDLNACPCERQQVCQSLDTDLLENARAMLAVEVSEFDFTVARHRSECAGRRFSGALFASQRDKLRCQS